jgi:hypothetical protein
MQVIFIDSSVLCNLLGVPGFSDRAVEMQGLFRERWEAGIKFVLPITSIIETGNHIAQCCGDRYAAAERFRIALEAAVSRNAPWIIHDVEWDSAFMDEVLAGDSTGSTLVQHFTNNSLSAGDLTILVERDRFAAKRSFDSVEVWTLDENLDSYSGTETA